MKKNIFFFKTFANKYFKNLYLSFFGINLSIKVDFKFGGKNSIQILYCSLNSLNIHSIKIY
jgi:hypothetical protein